MEFRRGEDKRCTVNALSVPALGELFEAGLESAVQPLKQARGERTWREFDEDLDPARNRNELR